MKKVLLTATAGGFVPQFELNNVKLLQADGYEVHYAANFDNRVYQWKQDELEKQQVVLHHVDFKNSLLDFRVHRKAFHQLVEVIIEEQIDVVHCHTPFASVLTRLAVFHSKRDIYVIYTAHGFHFYNGAPKKNWMFYPIEKYLSKKTDVLITINREDCKRAKDFFERTKCKVIQIPGVGLDVERFKPRPELYEQVRKDYQIPEDAFHLVTIGELSTEKNIFVVLEAMEQLRDQLIYYSIFGRGEQKQAIAEYIKKNGLEDRVRLCGYTTEPERVLQGADVFVFPSMREGLGMAALEAMACGVPVIAGDNRGTREYMQHGVNGLVCKKSTPDTYIKHILQMLKMYQEDCDVIDKCYSEYKIASRKIAEKFRMEHTEKIMKEVYRGIDDNNIVPLLRCL